MGACPRRLTKVAISKFERVRAEEEFVFSTQIRRQQQVSVVLISSDAAADDDLEEA